MVTIADAITQSRQIIQDVRVPYRNSDSKLVGYFNNAILDAFNLRPDLFLVPGTTGATWVDPTLYSETDISGGTEFPIPIQYFAAFVEYVAGYVGTGDDEFVLDQRAGILLTRFTQKLKVGNA